MPPLGLKGDCGISAATPAEHVIYTVFCIADCCLIAGKVGDNAAVCITCIFYPDCPFANGCHLIQHGFYGYFQYLAGLFVGYFPFGHNIIGGSLFDIFCVLGKHLGEKFAVHCKIKSQSVRVFAFQNLLFYIILCFCILGLGRFNLCGIYRIITVYVIIGVPLQARIQCYIILPCLHRMLRASGKQGQQYAYKQKG